MYFEAFSTCFAKASCFSYVTANFIAHFEFRFENDPNESHKRPFHVLPLDFFAVIVDIRTLHSTSHLATYENTMPGSVNL